MRLLKAKAKADSAASVTRAEFEELTRRFDAFKRIVAIGYMASEESGKYPGVCGGVGSAHQRMGKIAAVAAELFGLDDAAVRELRGFLELVKEARDGERDREAAEIRARDNLRDHPWNADGSYGRRIL